MEIDSFFEMPQYPVALPQNTINRWIDLWKAQRMLPSAVSINIAETLDRFRQSSDPAEKEKLVLLMFQAKFPEIVKTAQKTPSDVLPENQLIFAGCRGFCCALEEYDPEEETGFDHYCLCNIKCSMYYAEVRELIAQIESSVQIKVRYTSAAKEAYLYFPETEDEIDGIEAVYFPENPEHDFGKYPEAAQKFFRENNIENPDDIYLSTRIYGEDQLKILRELQAFSGILKCGWKLVPLPESEEDVIWKEYQENKEMSE